MKRIAKNRQHGNPDLVVLSYNIHQGITASRRQIAFSILKQAIKSLDADVVLLQEVAGSTRPRKNAPADRERAYQLEALADEIWPYQAYQRNSAFSGGYHGNAILSRFPILKWNVLNISVKGLARRGVLHGELSLPHHKLHVLGTHLGLLQYERHRQLNKLCHYVAEQIPAGAPLLVGGDFNDWREYVSKDMAARLKMDEAFLTQDARHARTFPAGLPVLPLDRIYFRKLEIQSAVRLKGRPWKFLSDHLPLLVHFKLRES